MKQTPLTRRVIESEDFLRRLIDDLEHAASLGHEATPLSPLLSDLRLIRDRRYLK